MPVCSAIASSRSAAARAMCRSASPSRSGASSAKAASASGCPARAPARAAASASRSATCPASSASSGTLPAGTPLPGTGILHPRCSHAVGEPFRPAGDHLAPGLVPALGDVPLDQPRRAVPLVLRLPGLPGALLGPFLLDVEDSEPQRLDRGIVVRELGARFQDLPHLPVERLDRIRRVKHLSQG